MCDTCGCGQPDDRVTIRKPGNPENKISQEDHGHPHTHGHQHGAGHHHAEHHHHEHGGHHPERQIMVEQDILYKNNLLAERNRGFFEAKGLVALNLVSSPGSGKTSLLERTLKDLHDRHHFYVVEGDQQTMNDADRIHRTGTQVVQVNTGQGCHLDSNMIQQALRELEISEPGFLMIENVGNLVCPALFDLGESKRVVIMSTTEGDDKPVKYPTMFESAHLCIINKTDLLPYVDFDMTKALNYALQVNHHLEFLELSVRTGDGMDGWYQWLDSLLT